MSGIIETIKAIKEAEAKAEGLVLQAGEDVTTIDADAATKIASIRATATKEIEQRVTEEVGVKSAPKASVESKDVDKAKVAKATDFVIKEFKSKWVK
ncbi:MAG: hypothetical protein FWE38_02775 [Firmicutes bacterium]|nr:hypothetical protein [Bacillota bacterium]